MKIAKAVILIVVIAYAVNAQVASPIPSPEKQKVDKTNQTVSRALMQAELTDVDGRKFRLDEFRGKVILLNIWGSWCGPCRPDMSGLVDLQTKYDRRDFEVIGLNIGDGTGDPETVRAMKIFAYKMKVNYYLAQSTNAITREFYSVTGAQVVPQSILIDREGRLQGVFIGGGPTIHAVMRSSVNRIVNQK